MAGCPVGGHWLLLQLSRQDLVLVSTVALLKRKTVFVSISSNAYSVKVIGQNNFLTSR